MATKKKSRAKRARKKSPQEIKVERERKIATATNFEKIVVAVEKSKMKLKSIREEWDKADRVFRVRINVEQLNLNRFNRLLKYKKEQIK